MPTSQPFSHLAYAVVLFFSGGVALLILALAWPRRRAPGGLPLALSMLGMLLWTWSYALHWLFPDWPRPFFWLDATYLGVVSAPTLFFMFAVEITNHPGWLSRRNLALLCIEPALTFVLLWSDPLHGLFFGGGRSAGSSDILSGGPWFWFNVVYSYTLLLLVLILLIASWLRQRAPIYRHQIGASLFGLALLFATNVAAVGGFKPLPGLDLTPFFFIFAGIFFAYSILGFRLFDLLPVAQDTLIDQMQDGMLVLDAQERLVDVNRAALELLGGELNAWVGKPLPVVLELVDLQAHAQELAQVLAAPRIGRMQVRAGPRLEYTLDVRIDPLQAAGGEARGWLVTWRDISQHKGVEAELRRANQKLSEQLVQIERLQSSLREQALRDPLTGLHNRRYLDEILPKELARAERSGRPLSILTIDIDHFKQINDAHGHAAGDAALRWLASRLQATLRKGDVVVRLGGEEFLVAMIDAPLQAALRRGEALRHEVETTLLSALSAAAEAASPPQPQQHFSITISIGVAAYPKSGSDPAGLLQASDQALYRAKAAGRNTVRD